MTVNLVSICMPGIRYKTIMLVIYDNIICYETTGSHIRW